MSGILHYFLTFKRPNEFQLIEKKNFRYTVLLGISVMMYLMTQIKPRNGVTKLLTHKTCSLKRGEEFCERQIYNFFDCKNEV